ncbi:MGH1-like glycoside hydrolase domain-containing protein [Segetibacter aerophilus]|uniref:Glucosidase n=1 Tax=Segetibacter aerophilus TaxID=670293 RepID=A0A512BB22_9BACT|nr:glucosidase [Segetibacter aerophilus]GEO09085.1 glucosidase [Segetibacter aerophilus]
MTAEELRLQKPLEGKSKWKKWGPYVSDRQWGTVREDYSADGKPWDYLTHDMARSKAYRWGEDGIAGISDNEQLLCFSVCFWNKKDPIIKERLFGLGGNEGNHGEDVKELYYYLDSTPTHSYMKMLYKYPQSEFPYSKLVEENRKRDKLQPEYELMDTGIFDEDKYFDIFVEYAKATEEDLLIKITIHNRGDEDAALHVLPQLWFRNTWSWGYNNYKPHLTSCDSGNVLVDHQALGHLTLHLEKAAPLLFCENETNTKRLYGVDNKTSLLKDGINEFLVNGNKKAVSSNADTTKVAVNYEVVVKGKESTTIRLRLSADNKQPFEDFESIFKTRIDEADEFYASVQNDVVSEEDKMIQRQAYAGMLWSKQFYYYDVDEWLKGDPAQPPPSPARLKGRNHEWKHLNNANIISMPDKWEYPWYAAWDLAFHCIPISLIDPHFAKGQLLLLTKDWYMHPNGQFPAYEWLFSDVNPPVHAWATWRVYKNDEKQHNGKGDTAFLQAVYHRLLINFTWWVNRKDAEGNNIFEGGFLGLDNIGVFDRSAPLPSGGTIEQADGTSWMAMYSLNMMRIALELSRTNPVYQDMASKFFEHFLYIAGAMASMGDKNSGLWDDEDNFYYDTLKMKNDGSVKLKVRSMVGLIPLFAVEVIDHQLLEEAPEFAKRLKWFLNNRPDLASLVSRWQDKNEGEKHLLSLLRGHRMKKILERVLDENEFLSEYGVRSLSKVYEKHPYEFELNGTFFNIHYSPGESPIGMFGGNSNWRGPIWMPVNFLIIESIKRFHSYYGDDFRIECPKGSGEYMSLAEVAEYLSKRLSKLFLKDENGRRPFNGADDKLQRDPNFCNYILFYEHFHGDNGRGVGASHQTGWTGSIANLLQPKKDLFASTNEEIKASEPLDLQSK